MTDWSSSMQQTFEYYIVDPGTWQNVRRVDTVKSSTINRDSSAETLGSASLDIGESLGECYIRIYMITIQNGVTERHPLGTFLIQTPSYNFDGKTQSVKVDAYTPLLELKENPPALGYSIIKNENIMEYAYKLVRENARAPVSNVENDKTLYNNFVANTDDTWLTFINDLLANANYYLDLDEMGRILFAPKQNIESMQPIWTYNDNNSSILYPDVGIDRDLYGIPNVVEVIYSNGARYFSTRVENNDDNSPISIKNRGREIIHRVTNHDLPGNPSNAQLEKYAKDLLKELSSLEYTISYKHGYCPVRLGDCVRLNYDRAGLRNVKARVISQSIECKPGCSVTEKAIFTNKLWEG